MLFVMVNASPGGVNRQVVVLSRPGRCNRPRMGVDTNANRQPISGSRMNYRTLLRDMFDASGLEVESMLASPKGEAFRLGSPRLILIARKRSG